MNDTTENDEPARYDYGPLCSYEITWKSGHVETLQGHQVMLDSTGGLSFSFRYGYRHDQMPRVRIHGMFGDRWRLVLYAPEEDILSIRDVTGREVLRDGAT